MNKTIALLFAVAVSLHVEASTVFADFAAGAAAYKNGDYATAYKEYLQLAEQGDVRAQLSLGLMYQTGKGVPKNDNEALKWYYRATEHINKDAIIQDKNKDQSPAQHN